MHTHLDRLYDHLGWADRLLLEALENAGAPSEPVLRLLAHLFSAERIWLKRLRNEDTSTEVVWPAFSLAQCRSVAEASLAGFREVLGTATAERLAGSVSYRTTKGQPMETVMEDILIHVALHGAYHRGQIAALLRREGQEPPTTDYIAFARAKGSGS